MSVLCSSACTTLQDPPSMWTCPEASPNVGKAVILVNCDEPFTNAMDTAEWLAKRTAGTLQYYTGINWSLPAPDTNTNEYVSGCNVKKLTTVKGLPIPMSITEIDQQNLTHNEWCMEQRTNFQDWHVILVDCKNRLYVSQAYYTPLIAEHRAGTSNPVTVAGQSIGLKYSWNTNPTVQFDNTVEGIETIEGEMYVSLSDVLMTPIAGVIEALEAA